MEIPNKPLYDKIYPLHDKLMATGQEAFGYISSGLRNSVKHHNPDIRKKIQNQVDNASNGLLIIFLFAMWEEYVERDVENEWLSGQILERLNAFRHIRHSFAHGFEGTRARQCRKQFESVMNGSNPFPYLVWDNNKIDITNSQVALDCRAFMNDTIKKLIGHVINNNKPVKSI